MQAGNMTPTESKSPRFLYFDSGIIVLNLTFGLVYDSCTPHLTRGSFLMRSSVLHRFVIVLVFFVGCSEARKTPAPAAESAAVKVPEAAPATVYDLSKDDITKIQSITSRNISVEGVKLGDR